MNSTWAGYSSKQLLTMNSVHPGCYSINQDVKNNLSPTNVFSFRLYQSWKLHLSLQPCSVQHLRIIGPLIAYSRSNTVQYHKIVAAPTGLVSIYNYTVTLKDHHECWITLTNSENLKQGYGGHEAARKRSSRWEFITDSNLLSLIVFDLLSEIMIGCN